MANFETLYNPLVLAGLTDKKPNVSLSFESGYKYLKAVGIQPKDLSDPYLITTPISLNAGEEILFVYKGAISPNIYAVSKVTINGTEKEYKGLVRTDQGVFVANQECYISYAAPEAMLVSLCYFKGSGDNTLSMVAYVTQNRLALFSGQLGEGIVYDKPDSEADISTLFDRVGVTYVIRYAHTSTSPVSIPEGCTLDFRGGNLRGIQSLTFNGTLLKGAVDLRTSLITENSTIRNLTFNADWVCPENKDSVDCTPYVQCIIDAFPHVIFPEGDFLFSQSKNNNAVPDSERFLLKLSKNNRRIEGEPGAVLRTGQQAGLLYVGNTIKVVTNIRIQGITFYCENSASEVRDVEHLHTIGLYGVKDVTICGCRFKGYYGDAVFLTFANSAITNVHVRIVDNHIDGMGQHNRNGISIDDGTDILICNNLFENTSTYNDSVAAIDFEPPSIYYHVDGVTIISNHFCTCGKKGAISLVSEHYGNNFMPISNVRILNNEISNCSGGIFIKNTGSISNNSYHITGNYIIRGNIAVGTSSPFSLENSPKESCKWIITENIFGMNDNSILTEINSHITVTGLIVSNNI